MSNELPDSSPYVVLGGGVHGLSSAYHLALALEESGKGSGRDVIVLEKNHLGAGASGIACGVVRNFYFSPAMAEVIRVSVELFESDPAGFGFHGVGYIAAVPAVQAEDVIAIQKHQAEIGYRSDVILGERRVPGTHGGDLPRLERRRASKPCCTSGRAAGPRR